MNVKLELSIIFDPKELWTSADDFVSDFTKDLEKKGLMADLVQDCDEPNPYEPTFIIRKDPNAKPEEKKQ